MRSYWSALVIVFCLTVFYSTAAGASPIVGQLWVFSPQPIGLDQDFIALQDLKVLRDMGGDLQEVANIQLGTPPYRLRGIHADLATKHLMPGMYRLRLNGQLSRSITIVAGKNTMVSLGSVFLHDAITKQGVSIAAAIQCGDRMIELPANKLFSVFPQACVFGDKQIEIFPQDVTQLFNSPAIRFNMKEDWEHAAQIFTGSFVNVKLTTQPGSQPASERVLQREPEDPLILPDGSRCLARLPFGVLSLPAGSYELSINGIVKPLALEKGQLETIRLYKFSLDPLIGLDDEFSFELLTSKGENVLVCRNCLIPQIEPVFEKIHESYENIMLEAGEYTVRAQGVDTRITIPRKR